MESSSVHLLPAGFWFPTTAVPGTVQGNHLRGRLPKKQRLHRERTVWKIYSGKSKTAGFPSMRKRLDKSLCVIAERDVLSSKDPGLVNCVTVPGEPSATPSSSNVVDAEWKKKGEGPVEGSVISSLAIPEEKTEDLALKL
ncbi:hypothetical protein chiPu_0017313 [Chiloscyllium punctatum]|uniref:Uncharacterized protein n=1 Tax=Chiloscyllium punctatum TaxID=137246 RepID=A0A401REW5_CHIPU|nr:hypothetical protein [Chiloscyllium punctatum]